MTDRRSRLLDRLIALWMVLAALMFLVPPILAAFCGGRVWRLAVRAEGLAEPGRCVYVAVLGICLAAAALRGMRTLSKVGPR